MCPLQACLEARPRGLRAEEKPTDPPPVDQVKDRQTDKLRRSLEVQLQMFVRDPVLVLSPFKTHHKQAPGRRRQTAGRLRQGASRHILIDPKRAALENPRTPQTKLKDICFPSQGPTPTTHLPTSSHSPSLTPMCPALRGEARSLGKSPPRWNLDPRVSADFSFALF